MTVHYDMIALACALWCIAFAIYLMHKHRERELKRIESAIEQETRHHEQLVDMKKAADERIRLTISQAELYQAKAAMLERILREQHNQHALRVDSYEDMRHVLAGTHSFFAGMPDDVIHAIQNEVVNGVMQLDIRQMMTEAGETDKLNKVDVIMPRVYEALRTYDLTAAMLELRKVSEYHPKLTVMHETVHRLRVRYLSATGDERTEIEHAVDEIVQRYEEGG